MTTRRELLGWMAGAGAVALLGCDDDAGATGGIDGGVPGACARIPAETAGPFPGDGSNGANALALAGIVRRDIRSSLGALSGTAEGVPLTVTLRLVNSNAACAPLPGYAVYVWHCDREAQYSMYTLTTQNYLRGVQEADADGYLGFTTVFPGCYAGRWPHLHFAIYRSAALATSSASPLATSQLALPKDACDAAYATAGYAQSVANLARISLATDGVFRDGAALQTAAMSGGVASGFTAALTVGVPA